MLFAMAVIADDITAAFATVAFVAFISLLVDRTYTATQYALLASIGTAGRTTLASSSGVFGGSLNSKNSHHHRCVLRGDWLGLRRWAFPAVGCVAGLLREVGRVIVA